MSYELRKRLVDIAKGYVGKNEVTRNQAPWIKPFWAATNYPTGHADRAPYCAAAVCYWVKLWLADTDVLKAMGMSSTGAEKWRCKSARAFDWIPWARSKGLLVLDDNRRNVLHTGDIMVFDMSHIGIVETDHDKGDVSYIYTIEANTGEQGGRDGEGCFAKVRDRSMARAFIRLMD
jgi:hypothetical protein